MILAGDGEHKRGVKGGRGADGYLKQGILYACIVSPRE